MTIGGRAGRFGAERQIAGNGHGDRYRGGWRLLPGSHRAFARAAQYQASRTTAGLREHGSGGYGFTAFTQVSCPIEPEHLPGVAAATQIKHRTAGRKVAETLAKEFGTGKWPRFG